MKDYIDYVVKLTDLTQNKPINELVYEGLRTAIIKGVLPVGERIKETEFAEKMNISRTPIREAIRRIEDEGLIEYIPHYGVIVKRVSKEDVEEIFKIRVALETLATKNAMETMGKEEFQEMRELLEKTEEANLHNQVNEVVKLFSDFNEMVYRFSRMPRLEHIVNRLQEYIMRFRDISLNNEARRQKALEEHWIIYDIMKDKNFDVVELIISNHLDYSKSYILNAIEEYDRKLEKPYSN